jgi:hypothetical protein
MELDLQSLFGLHVQSCTHWLRPGTLPHPPALGLVYEGAIGQPKLTTSPCDPRVTEIVVCLFDGTRSARARSATGTYGT